MPAVKNKKKAPSGAFGLSVVVTRHFLMIIMGRMLWATEINNRGWSAESDDPGKEIRIIVAAFTGTGSAATEEPHQNVLVIHPRPPARAVPGLCRSG